MRQQKMEKVFFQAINIKVTMVEHMLTQKCIYQISSKKYLNGKLICAGILCLVLAKAQITAFDL